jgi:uncharacterized lipoprotein YajG
MKKSKLILLAVAAVVVMLAGCQKQKAEVAEKAPPGAASTSPGASAPAGGTPAATQPQGE